jgi:hypothetical protein
MSLSDGLAALPEPGLRTASTTKNATHEASRSRSLVIGRRSNESEPDNCHQSQSEEDARSPQPACGKSSLGPRHLVRARRDIHTYRIRAEGCSDCRRKTLEMQTRSVAGGKSSAGDAGIGSSQYTGRTKFGRVNARAYSHSFRTNSDRMELVDPKKLESIGLPDQLCDSVAPYLAHPEMRQIAHVLIAK